jgi:hypothetical protein
MGLQTCNDEGPRAAGGNVTASGIPNRLIYCLIFILLRHSTNAAVGRIVQPGGPQFAYPWSKKSCQSLISTTNASVL